MREKSLVPLDLKNVKLKKASQNSTKNKAEQFGHTTQSKPVFSSAISILQPHSGHFILPFRTLVR